ncbi:MAG TPA: DUF4127 family protein [Opitutaceae bacterium]|nr:DUF4127 family protein [Opitutaceae bacterium]
MKRVAVLPMDDRPVNYDYPRYLSRAAGLDLLLPPREWLGNPWRASRHAELAAWLAETAPAADAAVVAIDTLAYGGLIPSRRSPDPTEAVLARLEILRAIKAVRPALPILASSVVMRVCRSDSSEEEKPYWATYGSRMFRLSSLEHKARLGDATPAEIDARDSLRAEIPGEVYADYRSGRARNHTVNRAMIDWAAEGVFDYLILPQDDTDDYGWNVAEARSLQAQIRARRLGDRAITYPGADEIGCLLLARFACREAGFAPRVWPRYSAVTGPFVVTEYEDRPLQELLKAHLAPLGGTVADSPQDADLMLFVNSPAERQANGDSQWLVHQGLEDVRARMPPKFHPWLEEFAGTEGFRATVREIQSPGRNPEEFVRALMETVASGRPAALADVAYVNASDTVLGDLLRQQTRAAALAAYGGWNTAGNTLGTVLAQAVIRVLALRAGPTPEQRAAHLEFLFLRFLDDDLYQGRERTRCMVEDLPGLGIAPTMERLPEAAGPEVEARVGANLGRSAAGLRDLFVGSGLARDVRVDHIRLPWRRLFEVGFDVRVEPG